MSRVLRTYLASLLTRKHPLHDPEKLNSSIRSSNVALNPHQVDAAVFAFNSPLSRGAVLADEVGLGKTIEAGLIINQLWVEGRRRILILVPASLRTQWMDELQERFGLDSTLIDSSKVQKLINEKNELNPFANGGIFIASHNFGSSTKHQALMRLTRWDLVVIDEAHRMRNVYRKGNKTAKRLKENIEGRPKLLLTATPLQNNLMELYGLVSFVDEKLLGTAFSFKTLYQNRGGKQGELSDLRSRLMGTISPDTGETEKGIVTRTLRKQVKDFVKFTNRHCLTEPFDPDDDEIDLYEGISDYLGRPYLASTKATQRNMMELVYRKILSSSSYAVSGTLERLTQLLAKRLQLEFKTDHEKLQKMADDIRADEQQRRGREIEPLKVEVPDKKDLQEAKQLAMILDDVEEVPENLTEAEKEALLDIEAEAQDDLGEDEDTEQKSETEAVPKTEREIDHVFTEAEVLNEFEYILHHLFLARSIQTNQKGQSLLKVLKELFEHNKKKQWPQKAVIFTESRRTQDYLERLLTDNGLGKGIVLFNGSNASDRAKKIYEEWAEKFPDEAKQNSPSINKRRALIWKFKQPDSHILITTEAGAEGLNLQFCNVIINYDLPWNPQRIEQRIGRCHRYGQELDVLVINFLNKKNYADQRIYELLREKICLFGNLFDFSDKILGTEVQTDDGYDVREVALGSLDSGVGFEKRILEIIRKFRTQEEIKAEFDKLQQELQDEIRTKIENVQRKVIQHFDEEVQKKLKLRDEHIKASLSRYDEYIRQYVFLTFGDAFEEVQPQRYRLQKCPDELVNAEEKYVSATYGVGEVGMEEQEKGIIPLSTRASILQPFLSRDRALKELSGIVTLQPKKNPSSKRQFAEWSGCEGFLVVHRLTCKQQNAVGQDEEFEEFAYSAIIHTNDRWELVAEEDRVKRLLDPSIVEWKDMREDAVRIRDDLNDVLPKHLKSKEQLIIDRNESFIDRQREVLSRWTKESLLRNQREMEAKQQEIDDLERQLTISKTLGAHERREIRSLIEKKQREHLKSQEKYFEAQRQAFKVQDDELKVLQSKLQLTITPERLLTLRFTIA